MLQLQGLRSVTFTWNNKKNLSSLNNTMTVAMQRKRRSNAAFSVPGAMAATNIFWVLTVGGNAAPLHEYR